MLKIVVYFICYVEVEGNFIRRFYGIIDFNVIEKGKL